MSKYHLFFNKIYIFLFVKRSLFLFFFSNFKLIVKFFSACFIKFDKTFLSLIFTSRYIFSGFLKIFLNSFGRFSNIYFFKLYLKGLGFRVRRICNSLYKFFFVFTNFFYLHLPVSVGLKAKRRRLIFFGFDLNALRCVLVNLLLLNRVFVYIIRGFLFPKQIIFLKPGKKRL